MSSEAALNALIKRLETAVLKLEGGGAAASTATAPSINHSAPAAAASHYSGSSGSDAAVLVAFDDIVNTQLKTFLELSEYVGGLVKDQSLAVKRAFEVLRGVIAVASQSKKPSPADMPNVIKPLQEAIMRITEIRDKNRPSPLFNHLSAIADGAPALGWVVVEPTPGPFVGEMRDAATFYVNRVWKDFKEKDKKHVEWTNAWTATLTELQSYVKKYHTTGLAWNPKGGEARRASVSIPAPAPAAAAPAAAASGPKPGFLGELAKGDGLTSVLKHVDKSQMTHKNPELRASSVVPAAASGAASEVKHPAVAIPPKSGPPKLALEGNKWMIENQNNNNNVVVEKTDIRHVVYVYNCQNSTIKINGKVNAVTLDNCKKVGILLENVVSTVDIVNSKSIQVQITGKAPTIAIDKTDGAQLYLSKSCLDVEILTAKSSTINVLFEEKEGDYIEKAVPEQLKTTIVKGHLVTVPVEHKG